MSNIDSFAAWLKSQRRDRKMTQAELADATGLGRTYVTQIENGRVRLPIGSTRQKFHHVFGSDDDQLIDLGLLAFTSDGYEFVPPPASEAPRDQLSLPALEGFTIKGLDRVTANPYGVLGASMIYAFRAMNATQRRDLLKLLQEIDEKLNVLLYNEEPDF